MKDLEGKKENQGQITSRKFVALKTLYHIVKNLLIKCNLSPNFNFDTNKTQIVRKMMI